MLATGAKEIGPILLVSREHGMQRRFGNGIDAKGLKPFKARWRQDTPHLNSTQNSHLGQNVGLGEG